MRTLWMALLIVSVVLPAAAEQPTQQTPPVALVAAEGYGDVGAAMEGSATVADIVRGQRENVAREMGLDLTGLITPEAAAAARKLGEEILADAELEAATAELRRR